jgi:AraC family transcriptional regulator
MRPVLVAVAILSEMSQMENLMKVMVIIKASKESEAGVMPDEKLLTDMGNFNEELVKAGLLLSGDGLHPSSKGVRVRFSGKNRTVIDGPFAETGELVAGFWMWRVKSMDEAIEWVKRCPNPMMTESEIEIRQVFDPDDFGDVFTPELREQEAGILAQTMGLGRPRFEAGHELLIAGLNQTYTFETRANIPTQWHQFAPHIGKVPGQIGQTAFGVCLNYRSGDGFDYLTGVEVAPSAKLPAEFTSVRLAAQRYAVFTHTEHVSSIPKTIDAIWNQWIPGTVMKPVPAPCFERYTSEFNPETGFGGTEIWIPIQQ